MCRRSHTSVAPVLFLLSLSVLSAAEPITIGSRRELFVDDYLVARLTGSANLVVQQPTPGEVVLVTDKPWEGSSCLYFTIFQDGELYRMYYRGLQVTDGRPAHREVVCYAESRDGLKWMRPELQIVEFNGSKKNNIVWDGLGSHNFTPFIDHNPACRPEAKYKALGRGQRTPDGKPGSIHQLFAFQSPDGIRWSLMRDEPVLAQGSFDSQNVAFWDPKRDCYVAFYRDSLGGFRAIRTATSHNFLDWDEPRFLGYRGAARQHLYTNAIQRYDRAPHLLIGFPTRFLPHNRFPDRPDWTEPILIAGRDGRSFRLWQDPIIPANTSATSGNRSNYVSWGLVQVPGQTNEYSLYAAEDRRTGTSMRLRRYSYRTDGFVSVSARNSAGEVLTKPLTFSGNRLVVNYSAKRNGSLRVEISDALGRPCPGYELDNCRVTCGDEIDRVIAWNNTADVGSLAGQPRRLRFVLNNADLYSFQFLSEE
ncbi:MAG: hypothetical protein GY758_09295 [Fuerstiella sp.]|nr:hypothetical protein [Fuerstiella sp.]